MITSLRAKRSNPSRRHRKKDGLLRGACHRARIRATRWLAMTAKHAFAASPRYAPEPLINLPPNRGRGERRMPVAPAASCALGSGRTHTSNNEYPGITRRSRTQWFYGLFRALPGDRALLPPSPCGLKVLSSPVEPNEPPQDLTPASRRQDHTTSPSASSSLVS